MPSPESWPSIFWRPGTDRGSIASTSAPAASVACASSCGAGRLRFPADFGRRSPSDRPQCADCSIELILAQIFPFCAALGYLTSKLIDEVSQGQPGAAGKAYAVNAAGCILGPLAAGYLLLPAAGARVSLIILASPFLLAFALAAKAYKSVRPARAAATGALVVVLLAGSFAFFISYEDAGFFKGRVIRRDATATVISLGKGMRANASWSTGSA